MVLFLSENQTHLTFAAAFLGGYFFARSIPTRVQTLMRTQTLAHD